MARDLFSELKKEVDNCQVWARRNFKYAHLIFAVTVMASFVSAILVGSNVKDWPEIGLSELGVRIFMTALTALPAALLLINNTLRFEERSKWFWRKCRKVERLLRTMRDTKDFDRKVISQEFSDISEQMETEWPAFGSSPSQPKRTGIQR